MCHVHHSANTSTTGHTHRLLPKATAVDADGGEAFLPSFDRLFDAPCRALIAPVMRHLLASGARERARLRFTDVPWASQAQATSQD